MVSLFCELCLAPTSLNDVALATQAAALFKLQIPSHMPSVKRLHHRILIRSVNRTRPHPLAQPEDALYHTQLGRSSVEPCHGHPVINYHSCANNGRSPIHAAGHKRDLQKTRQLILILNRGFRMYNTSLIGESHIRTRKNVVGDCLAEYLNA